MWRDCIFYLSPCVAGSKFLSENLIPEHGGAITENLAHWARENSPVDPNADCVPESQAYPRMRKIIVVGKRRSPQATEIVEEVIRRGVRDRIDFIDWRALEQTSDKEQATNARALSAAVMKTIAENSFFGLSQWNAAKRQVEFSNTNIYKTQQWHIPEAS